MRRPTGVPGYLAAAAAVLAVIVGAGSLARERTGDGSTIDPTGGPWRAFPEAFPVSDEWQGGPYVLVADRGGCFAGFGRDGLGTAYWLGIEDCTRASNVTPELRQVGDGLPSEDRNIFLSAVPAHGGGYVALARHTFYGDAFAYETSVVSGDPMTGWRYVAEFGADSPREDPRAGRLGPPRGFQPTVANRGA